MTLADQNVLRSPFWYRGKFCK